MPELDRYKLTYWFESQCVHIDCLIDHDTVELLLCATTTELPAFVKFLVDDGEEMIIPTSNVIRLKQVFADDEIRLSQNDV